MLNKYLLERDFNDDTLRENEYSYGNYKFNNLSTCNFTK